MPIEIVDSMPRTGTKGWMLVDVDRDSEGRITSETVVSWKTYKGKPAARDALWDMSQPKRTVIGEEMTVFRTTNYEIDELIHLHYPTRGDWNSSLEDTFWPGTLVLIEATGIEWHYDRRVIDWFISGEKSQKVIEPLLHDLVHQNIIPAGYYLIEVREE